MRRSRLDTLKHPAPWHGLKVIDASRVLAGPSPARYRLTKVPDVVKIEAPEGDECRGFGPPFVHGSSAYFNAVNRNKRSLVLDLSRPQERERLFGLLDEADVLIENFKLGTLAAWGIAEPAWFTKRFARLIHCRITGFGDQGPYGGLPGYDAAVQAMAGLLSINGEAQGSPVRIGVPVLDLTTGMNAAMAVLLALQARQRTGRGQMADVSLYDSALSVAIRSHELSTAGRVPGPHGQPARQHRPLQRLPDPQHAAVRCRGQRPTVRQTVTALGMRTGAGRTLWPATQARVAHRRTPWTPLLERLSGSRCRATGAGPAGPGRARRADSRHPGGGAIGACARARNGGAARGLHRPGLPHQAQRHSSAASAGRHQRWEIPRSGRQPGYSSSLFTPPRQGDITCVSCLQPCTVRHCTVARLRTAETLPQGKPIRNHGPSSPGCHGHPVARIVGEGVIASRRWPVRAPPTAQPDHHQQLAQRLSPGPCSRSFPYDPSRISPYHAADHMPLHLSRPTAHATLASFVAKGKKTAGSRMAMVRLAAVSACRIQQRRRLRRSGCPTRVSRGVDDSLPCLVD
ncbi:hypothetical protein FQR65_LT20080 [Abscondita terminalis]|nr:hypothetical protein FQR65_LT20080 [Abscondita terminalis]